jgi:hypothetical protein
VIGTDALAGRELVHRKTELFAADQPADADVADGVAGSVVLVRFELDLEEVGDAHCSPSQ